MCVGILLIGGRESVDGGRESVDGGRESVDGGGICGWEG